MTTTAPPADLGRPTRVMMETSSLKRRSPAPWRVPAALILLSLVPILGGAVRLTELAGGADITPQNERFFNSPFPVLIHIVSATVYSLLGAFQFVPSLRRRRWHRVAGTVLVPAGLLAAFSGLWMAVFYDFPGDAGVVLMALRLLIGSSMVVSIALALLYVIGRRDFFHHSAWMTRAYAIGAAAGTEALIMIAPEIVSGPPGITTQIILTGAAWVINVAAAEYIIHRRTRALR